MRRFFFVLVLLNLLLLAWNLYESKQKSSEFDRIAIDFGGIQLLSKEELLQLESGDKEASELDVKESEETNELITSSDGQDVPSEKIDEVESLDTPQEKEENRITEDRQKNAGFAVKIDILPDGVAVQAEVEEYSADTDPTGGNQLEKELFKECGSIGQLEQMDAAELLGERLANQGINVKSRTATSRKRAGFWVIIPPYKDRKSAINAENSLKEKAVSDIWRFLKGEFKNGISLGMYSRRKNAEIRKRSIEEKGFYPEVIPRFREIKRYWVDYELLSLEEKTKLQAILAEFQKIDVELKDCFIPEMENLHDPSIDPL